MAHPLDQVTEATLQGLGRAADRLLAGRPVAPLGRDPLARAGRGEDLLDHRQWRTGDDPKAIDWRLSARRQELQVRRYREARQAPWCLCLDASASMTGAKWALGLQLTAAWAFLLLHRGQPVGLRVFSAGLDLACPPGRGRHHYPRLLADLRTLSPRPGGSRPAVCGQGLAPRTSLVVIGDLLGEAGQVADLERLALGAGDLHLLGLEDDHDARLPAAAPLLLEDAEAGTLAWVAPGVEESAHRRLKQDRAEVAAFCRRRGIPYSPCEVGRPWRDHLLGHLARLARG